MANTRSFKSLGIIASDANKVTEDGPRTVGEPYRRTNLTDAQQIEGELYDVNPRTEFLNQKEFNQSSFTDLIDSRGTLGWTDLVDYSPPAFVWASDGTLGTGDFYVCLKDNGPNSFVVDPITDPQSNPIYWRIVENAQQLRLDLADETPGSEGSRLVGYNYVDINSGVDDGLTVKTALDNAFLSLRGINGLDILATGMINVVGNTTTPPTISSVRVYNNFNISIPGITLIPGLDGVGDPKNYSQGILVTFDAPIPASYNVQVCAQIADITYIIDDTGVGQLVSYRNALTTSIEVYFRYYPHIPLLEFTRQLIPISLICYRYNP